MMYDTILARSFSRQEQKKLGYGAFVGCFIIVLSFCSLFKHLGPLPILNLRLSTGIGLKMLVAGERETNSSRHSQQFFRGPQVIDAPRNKMETNNNQMQQTVGDSQVYNQTITNKMETNNTWTQQLVTDSQVYNQTITNKLETNATSQQVVTDFQSQEIHETKKVEQNKQIATESEDATAAKTELLSCNVMEERSDFCELKGDIRVEGRSSSVLMVTSQLAENSSWSLKPYARKGDIGAMSQVKEWSVKAVNVRDNYNPQCTKTHNVPAVLFSTGGYAGNHFHAFSDVIIPLYLTSRRFDRQVQFLVTNNISSLWTTKFQEILRGLSRFEIIDIDKTQQVHCFPSITVGLKRHRELNIDSSRSPHYSMRDFRAFLRSSYSLKRARALEMGQGEKGKYKPRLLIISRKRSRSFTNTGSIARMARGLGFDVMVSEADLKVARFAEMVNSCDVVMGVHGAGLTNIVFLPENAVVIQVVPLGNMAWLANTYFEVPSKDMNIRYLKYDIKEEESTLIQQYPKDHVVFRDPYMLQKQGWEAFRAVYMDKQNVKLDVKKFKPTLLKALELLHHHQH